MLAPREDARDDGLAPDLTVNGTDLSVLDRAVAIAVELIEVDLRAAGGGALGLDGDRDETDPEESFPTCAGAHAAYLLGASGPSITSNRRSSTHCLSISRPS